MIEITKLDHQGRGIGRINNKIVFVPNTLPGEIVEIKYIKEKKNYIEGQAIKYIKKSNKRQKPLCKYYNICGGCNLMHLSYQDELEYKQKKVEEIIYKYTDKNINIKPIIPCEKEYNYRNKITFHTNNKIGLYKKDTNEIIDIDNCLLADNNINNILKELKKLNYTNEDIVVRSNNNKTLIYYKGTIDNIKNINADTIINNKQILKGNGHIEEYLNNLKFIISPTSFFQVNTKQTLKLYEQIKKLAILSKGDNILDLYCGTGTIGLYLSKYCKQVLGVEINEEAINDANINKQINNISNAKFIKGDAKKVITDLHYKPDIIIVDPPRSGLFKGMVEDLCKFNAKKIIYVSCDPITLSRDLKVLNKKYKIELIQPVDMFPHTHHVENIAILEIK